MLEFSSAVSDLLPGYALKIGVSFLCGLILGLERERKDKPAGLRTIILISIGSTLFMIVSELMALVAEGPTGTTSVDPSRIAAQVVTGVGFLGAGSIIQSRGSVRGLTTAAVIWVAAALGLCAGAGFPLLALSVTILVVAALTLMHPLRTLLNRMGDQVILEIVAPNDSFVLKRIELAVLEHDLAKQHVTTRPVDAETMHVSISLQGSNDAMLHVVNALSSIQGVRGVRIPHEESVIP